MKKNPHAKILKMKSKEQQLSTVLKSCSSFKSRKSSLIDYVGTLPQLIGFIRFGEPVPHDLSAHPRVWAGPTKG